MWILERQKLQIGKHCLARQVSALVFPPLFFFIILVCSMQGRTGGALSAVETLQRVAAFCRWLLSSRSALWFGLRLFVCIFTLRQKHMQPKKMRRRAIVTSTMQISINQSDARRRKDDGGDNGLLAGCESAAAQQQLLSEGSIWAGSAAQREAQRSDGVVNILGSEDVVWTRRRR